MKEKNGVSMLIIKINMVIIIVKGAWILSYVQWAFIEEL